MADSDPERSRIANNRLAIAVVVGSVLVVAAISLAYRVGFVDYLLPEHGPAADAAPLYFLAAVVLLVLVVWSWGRLFSWFE